MASDNLVDIAAHRRRRRATAGNPKEPLPERMACVVIGSIIGGFGFSLAIACLSFGGPAQRFLDLLPAVPLFFIGVFGLNWVIQGIRGRSRHQGIFYLLLERLRSVGPRPWSLLVPAITLAALLLAAILDDSAALHGATGVLVAWLILMMHVAVHELGHYCAARFLKLTATRVLIGPAEFSRSSHGWTLELSRDWWSIFGGWVNLRESSGGVPPKALFWFAAGGPLATGLLVIAILVLSPVPPLDLLFSSSGYNLHHLAFSLGSQIAVGLLVINLIPSRNLVLGAPTDGHQILASFRQIRQSRGAV